MEFFFFFLLYSFTARVSPLTPNRAPSPFCLILILISWYLLTILPFIVLVCARCHLWLSTLIFWSSLVFCGLGFLGPRRLCLTLLACLVLFPVHAWFMVWLVLRSALLAFCFLSAHVLCLYFHVLYVIDENNFWRGHDLCVDTHIDKEGYSSTSCTITQGSCNIHSIPPIQASWQLWNTSTPYRRSDSQEDRTHFKLQSITSITYSSSKKSTLSRTPSNKKHPRLQGSNTPKSACKRWFSTPLLHLAVRKTWKFKSNEANIKKIVVLN